MEQRRVKQTKRKTSDDTTPSSKTITPLGETTLRGTNSDVMTLDRSNMDQTTASETPLGKTTSGKATLGRTTIGETTLGNH